jgi:hypothetical protein
MARRDDRRAQRITTDRALSPHPSSRALISARRCLCAPDSIAVHVTSSTFGSSHVPSRMDFSVRSGIRRSPDHKKRTIQKTFDMGQDDGMVLLTAGSWFSASPVDFCAPYFRATAGHVRNEMGSRSGKDRIPNTQRGLRSQRRTSPYGGLC